MSTEITVVNDIVEINVTEDVIVIEAPSGAYPLPTGVYSVYGRTGNVVAQDGDYNLTQLGDVTIVSPATGQVLRYNGTTWVNSTESYVGTVTSVAMTTPTGLTVTGSPITTAGTLAVGLESGYSIPTNANQALWTTAYNDKINSAAVTGTTTKTLTLNQQDGGTVTATWSDLQPVTSVFGRTGDVVAQSGDYNTLQVTENTNLYFTEQRARYSVSGDATSGVVYSNTTGIIALDDIPNTSLFNDSVTINSKTVALGGSTTLSTTDIGEGTNLYFTTARAQAAISGTAPISVTSGVVSISQAGPSTDGYLGSADWNTFNAKQSALTLGNLTSSDITVTGGTGAVVGSGSTLTLATVNSNVGTFGSSTAIPVITVNGKGLVTAVSTDAVFIPSGALSFIGDVTGTGNTGSNTTLTLATVNSNVGAFGDSVTVPTITVNAKGLVTAASQTAIPTATSSVTGLLTSTDWSTFNGKQAQLNGTGFVKVSGTTVSYDNSTYLTTIEGIAAGGELSGTYASPSLVNSAVTSKVLTGLNVTGGTVIATDSILDAFGKVQNQINGLIGGSIYQGTWNASTNTPTITSGVGTKGYYYIVSVAGTTNLDGITDWNVGDWAIFDGTAWQQVDNTDAVVSVNGQTGAVSLTTDNIPEGATNLYFTDARSRAALSFAAGSGAYNSTSGLITIPTNTNQLTNGASFITLASLSGSAPIQYNNTTGAISITQAGTASNGFLSSTDWNTFNNKQNVLTNPVTGTGTTNTLPKFTGTSAIGNSNITDTGSLITLGSNTYVNGSLGIGSTSLTGLNLRISKNITGATTSLGVSSDGQVQSDVTSQARMYQSQPTTVAATFTLGTLVHYFANQGTFGAGSTVTNQYGFWVNSNLTGATSNLAFRSDLAAAANTWNLYMNGTAANYMAGSLGIGSTSLTGMSLRFGKTITGATTSYSILNAGQIQSDVTTLGTYNRTSASTQATTFTLTDLEHYGATQGTIGAGSTITNQYGFRAESSLTGATNNYGFYGNIASGTNRWNLYMAGTASNYLAGVLTIGTASPNASAKVQIDSTTQGFLPPRMTAAQRAAISSPATGLMVYQTDGTEGVYVYSGGSWKSLTMV